MRGVDTRIDKNDIALLRDLADYRLMSSAQVAALHFGSKRSANHRLLQLLKAGVLDRFAGIPAQGRGRPEGVFCVTEAGLELLRNEGVISPDVPFTYVGGKALEMQVAHQLLLNWFRAHFAYAINRMPDLSTELLSCNSPFALDVENRYPALRDSIETPDCEGSTPCRQSFVPDGVFIIKSKALALGLLFFLEVDMGTETTASPSMKPDDLRSKILCYQAYYDQEKYKRYASLWQTPLNGFRLLFLAHSEQRHQGICALVRVMPASNFVWVSNQERLFREGASGDIWARGGHCDAPPESILGDLSCKMPIPELV